MGAGENSI